MFLRNCWYVAAWSHELGTDTPIGRKIIGEPIMLARRPDGTPFVLEDRCSHRRAALSLGRLESCGVRCMYHGLLFDAEGKCIEVPGSTQLPPNTNVRSFPIVERDSWLWVWMGDEDKADPELIPPAFGLDDPQFVMTSSQLDYEAHYELINDNLCDLSHVDFVHETTLGHATGGGWSEEIPRMKPNARGLRFERWFVRKPTSPANPAPIDKWSTYDYYAPGIFIMENRSFPHGKAEESNFGPPTGDPFSYRVEQQAVTPIDDRHTRYLYAAGFDAKTPVVRLEEIFKVVSSAFAEDKIMIEQQQKIWDATPEERPMAFLPQDKGPAAMRRLMKRLIKEEREAVSQAADPLGVE